VDAARSGLRIRDFLCAHVLSAGGSGVRRQPYLDYVVQRIACRVSQGDPNRACCWHIDLSNTSLAVFAILRYDTQTLAALQ
jgi:hypothetical protein